jgi:hypothetical protein
VVGGIVTVAAAIGEDIGRRLPRQHKSQREGLALLTATMLDVRSANLMDLAASLPRAAERLDMRYQWISRLLGNRSIDADAVMAPHGRELLARLAAGGRTVVLMIDQTQATGRHQVVVVAARVGGRALPLAWRVKETGGAIGFAEQREALEAVARLLPDGTARPVLMGDRFYGTPDLIAWCRERGWGWRLRLKRDLLVFEEGGETTLAACLARGERLLSGVELTGKRVATNVAMVHEPGHPEPWIIAMSEAPTAPPRLRLRAQVGHGGDVLRLRDQGLRPGGWPSRACRPAGPLGPGDGARPALGGLDRHVGRRPWRHPRRKKSRTGNPATPAAA